MADGSGASDSQAGKLSIFLLVFTAWKDGTDICILDDMEVSTDRQDRLQLQKWAYETRDENLPVNERLVRIGVDEEGRE